MPRAGKVLKNISIGNLWDEVQDIKQNLGMGFTRGNFKNIVRINKNGLQAGSGSFSEAPATIDPTGAATFRKVHQMMGWATKTWEDDFDDTDEVDTERTKLTADVAVAATSLPVVSTTNLSVGMYIDISDGVNFERHKISSIPNGTTLTLTTGLTNAFTQGTYVGRYTCKITGDGTTVYVDSTEGWHFISAVNDTADVISVPDDAIWAIVSLNVVGPYAPLRGEVILHRTGKTSGSIEEAQHSSNYIAFGSASWGGGDTIALTFGEQATAISGTAYFFNDGGGNTNTTFFAELPQDVDLGTGVDGSLNTTGNLDWNDDKNYTDVTINEGHTVTLQTGEVRIIKCQGTFTLNGKIDGKGKGNTGGQRATGGDAQSGVGTGGGAYGQTSGWNAGGGGGGGYGAVGGSDTIGGAGGTNWGQQDFTASSSELLGSGGGGGTGGGIYKEGGDGGYGGGALIIYCHDFIVGTNGEIDLNGNNGGNAGTDNPAYSAGGGGAGSGGSLYIRCQKVISCGTVKFHALGGTGGLEHTIGSYGYGYPGGNGAVGRIRVEANYITTATNPTYYSAGTVLCGKFFEGTYITLVEPHQIDKQFVIFEVTRNWTARYNLDSAITADTKTVKINGDKTAQFAVGDTVDIYDTNNYERERKIITAIDYNVTTASKTTITINSPFVNSYLTTAYIERVDILPMVSITESVALEEHQKLDWRGSEVSGSYVTDYYTYKASEGGTYCYFILYFSVNDISLDPKCSNFKVTLYP